jgi:penicillin-binding protein 2
VADYDFRVERVLERRKSFLLVFCAGVFLILVLRLFYLQVFRNDYYNRLALSNRIQKEEIQAPRGLIRASDGSKLVVNVPVYQINILPNTLRGKEDRLSLACSWLGIDEDELTEALDEWAERYPDGREMMVVQTADKERISVLMENRSIFPFFKLVMKHKRQYPEGRLAAHLLGYTGEVTDTDLHGQEELRTGDIIGRTGIEYIYEDYLRGQDGVKVVEISAEGTRIGEYIGLGGDEELEGAIESMPPVPGCDVYLSIDLKLQKAVEEYLDWSKGCVIAIDPRTGAVLAAASRPVYDPNIFLGGVSAKKWKELNDDPDKPLFNRCVQATYPPASTFKLIIAYAALRIGAITTGERLKPCYGGYQFGNRYFRCWKQEGHGMSNLFEAIVNSCDVYFYQTSERMVMDDIAYAGRLFGFGRKTGIDLPSEARGILPDHAYFDRKYGKGKWTRGHLLNYSIGQGEALATPLQLCQMTAMIANGGKRIRPHIVSRIEDSEGNIRYSADEEPRSIPQIESGLLRFVRSAMRDVVAGESGTGRAAAIHDVQVAGKTGTAQNPHGEDHAIFVAYAPARDPEIAISIVLEHAGHGGAMAAPMARRILQAYFHPETAMVTTGEAGR